MKKLANLFPRLQKAKWRKTPTDSTVIEPKYVGIPIFLHIPRAFEQGQICIYGFRRKIWLAKKLGSLLTTFVPAVQAKKKIIAFSVFLSTLQLAALLLKNVRLCFHYYTLR